MKKRRLLTTVIIFTLLLFFLKPKNLSATEIESEIENLSVDNSFDAQRLAYVNVKTILNLHSEPNVMSVVLRSLSYGMLLTVIQESENGYIYVETEEGVRGYVAADYILYPEEVDGCQVVSMATCVASSMESRDKNMAEATKRINERKNTLYPNDVFNWFDVVGNASVANGFYGAPVLVNGVSVEGEGGGVCQVSTTLYQAVNKVGMKIIERHIHSAAVSYTEKGTDATVSYESGLNFIFQNNSNFPIYIVANAEDGRATVIVYKVVDEKSFLETGLSRIS